MKRIASLLALLLSAYIGSVEVAPENHELFLKSVRTAFAAFSYSCLVGVAESMARGRVR